MAELQDLSPQWTSDPASMLTRAVQKLQMEQQLATVALSTRERKNWGNTAWEGMQCALRSSFKRLRVRL